MSIEELQSGPGIIGHLINLSILHFIYHLIVFVPLGAAYVILQSKMPLRRKMVMQEQELILEF
ncbi:MAG: hypothetical protein M3222_03880 [Thermoproteota archaeon]|jgi:hypothetical protein|nr:hypothetical protein [Thermoproteota archaeon]